MEQEWLHQRQLKRKRSVVKGVRSVVWEMKGQQIEKSWEPLLKMMQEFSDCQLLSNYGTLNKVEQNLLQSVLKGRFYQFQQLFYANTTPADPLQHTLLQLLTVDDTVNAACYAFYFLFSIPSFSVLSFFLSPNTT